MAKFFPQFAYARRDMIVYKSSSVGDEFIGGELNDGVIVESIREIELSARDKWDKNLKRFEFRVCGTYNDLRSQRENCEECDLFSRCRVPEWIKMRA